MFSCVLLGVFFCMCVFKFKYFGGFKLFVEILCVVLWDFSFISRPNKQSQMLTIPFLSTKQTRNKMNTSNNNNDNKVDNNNNNNKVDSNEIQLTITTGTTKIILDIVGTLTVSQVMNNSTAEAVVGVLSPASRSMLSPPTKKSKNEDDDGADSVDSGSSTEYEEDDLVPKIGSLKLNKTENRKGYTNPTTKKTSTITFDDDDYVDDNQFSQQHYW